VQEDRVVANDNAVRDQGGWHLQIPADPHGFHSGKATVRVHAYPNSPVAVFHGPRCLARYQPDGRMIEPGGTPSGRRCPTRGPGDRRSGDPRPRGCKSIAAPG
jgi:hypothetical protein